MLLLIYIDAHSLVWCISIALTNYHIDSKWNHVAKVANGHKGSFYFYPSLSPSKSKPQLIWWEVTEFLPPCFLVVRELLPSPWSQQLVQPTRPFAYGGKPQR